MPWKSKAQMRLFYAKNRRGEISDEDLAHWKSVTPNIKKLPERVKKEKRHEKTSSVVQEFARTAIGTEAFKPDYRGAQELNSGTGYAKSAARDGNLTDEAEEEENAKDFTQVVKGSQLKKDTAQARSSRAGDGVSSVEKREFPQSMRHNWRSSRG